MKRFAKLGGFLALVSTAAAAQEQAQVQCLTAPEARALFTFIIPEAVEGVAAKCKAALPATAFLPSSSAATVAKFREAAKGGWPAARAAFLKIGGPAKEADLMAKMSDATLQPFVSEAFAGVVANDVKPADCRKIDRFVAALAPIPPSNVADLITALIALVGEKKGDDLKLC
jgi:hypothetical protein